jgi:hypothetical protein
MTLSRITLRIKTMNEQTYFQQNGIQDNGIWQYNAQEKDAKLNNM